MDLQERDYLSPSEDAGREVLEHISQKTSTALDPEVCRVVTLYDTFDWRLWQAGSLLRDVPAPTRGRWLEWSPPDGQTIRQPLAKGTTPGFGWDLPEGPLRQAIAPLVEMRRLLPLAEMHLRSTTLRLIDENAKTLARLELVAGDVVMPGETARRTALAPRLRARPVRGYTKDFKRLCALLNARGQRPAENTLAEAAFAALDHAPGAYSSKPKIELDPATRADDALASILRNLLDAIETNEDGTRKDLDSEFLHDFRVAVRRTRSALGQMKGIFPVESIAPFRKGFSWLGKLTGPTRDLDVYLLKMPSYRATLPSSVAADLEPLEAFLTRCQREEQRRLAKTLGTARYRELLASWRAFLDDPPRSLAPHAERPIREVAAERIWKSWRRVRNRGLAAVEHHSPAEELHELRIDCKKLRYLLEFFRGLFEASEIVPLIKALKKLQDNLGDFNDYEVQQLSLRGFAERMQQEGGTSVDTVLAMGRLLDVFARGQEEERLGFAKHFETFANAENQARFKRLFKS